MTFSNLDTPISPLRQRLIDDMNLRRFDLARDAAQLSPRHRTPGGIPRAFTGHGDRR